MATITCADYDIEFKFGDIVSIFEKAKIGKADLEGKLCAKMISSGDKYLMESTEDDIPSTDEMTVQDFANKTAQDYYQEYLKNPKLFCEYDNIDINDIQEIYYEGNFGLQFEPEDYPKLLTWLNEYLVIKGPALTREDIELRFDQCWEEVSSMTVDFDYSTALQILRAAYSLDEKQDLWFYEISYDWRISLWKKSE